MRFLIAGVILFFPFLSPAVTDDKPEPKRAVYERQITDNPIILTDVLLQNRNARQGPYVRTNLRFGRWTPIPESFSIIGISDSHRLYHHVQIGEARFARLLSGQRCIKDFRIFAENGRLIALSCKNELLVYSPDVWEQGPMIEILRTHVKRSAIGITIFTVFAFLRSYFQGIDPQVLLSNPYVVSLAAALGISTVEAIRGYFKYLDLNRQPDGFLERSLFTYSLDNLRPHYQEAFISGNDIKSHWKDCSKIISKSPFEIKIKNEEDLF